jgi:hypothetical protein
VGESIIIVWQSPRRNVSVDFLLELPACHASYPELVGRASLIAELGVLALLAGPIHSNPSL